MNNSLLLFALLALVVAAATQGQADPPHHKTPSPDPLFGRKPAAPPALRSDLPMPEAYWLWAQETRDGQTILLRRTVELPQKPDHTIIHITADDAYRLYVNGKLVGSRPLEPDHHRAWERLQRWDVSDLVHAGRNVLAIRAFNVDGPSGVMALFDWTGPGTTAGRVVTRPDGTWRVREDVTGETETYAPSAGETPDWAKPDYDDHSWSRAADRGLLSSVPWNMPFDYPYGIEGASTPKMHTRLTAERVLRVTSNAGEIHGAEALTQGKGVAVTIPAQVTQSLMPPNTPPPRLKGFRADWPERAARLEKFVPSLVLDFGREVHGSLQLESASEAETEVRVKFGESLGEAEDGGLAMALPIPILPKGKAESGEVAFRYAKLYFLRGDADNALRLQSVTLDFRAYPVAYRGAFACSDELLTRLWYIGAYTAHLSMQEDVWDAPKRDRLRWMGDVNVEWPTIWAAFGDTALIEQTMHRLRVTGPPNGGHINGIAGYSLFWILSLHDLYTLTGDLAYLKANHQELLTLLDFFRKRIDGKGLFAEGSFVDWARLTPQEEKVTTHLLLCKALGDAVALLSALGDTANAAKIATWRDEAKAAARTLLDPATQTFGPRKHPNAMAIVAGVLTPEEARHVADATLTLQNKTVITPYYGDYVLRALALTSRYQEGLNFLRAYWGEMARRGATTFWEAFDPSWPAGEENDFHRHMDVVAYGGYRTSLCHAWASGPTEWLSSEVLGVRPTQPGGSEVEIAPHLGDLTWAEGRFPTPHGDIAVRHTKEADGGFTSVLTLPTGVTAKVGIPGSAQSGALTVGSKKVAPDREQEGYLYITASGPGRVTVRFRPNHAR